MMNEKPVKIRRHYQTKMQFISKETHLQNNKRLAGSRLVGIKSRMLGDKIFIMHYKNFIKRY